MESLGKGVALALPNARKSPQFSVNNALCPNFKKGCGDILLLACLSIHPFVMLFYASCNF